MTVRAGLPLRAIPSPLAPGNYPQPQGLTWKSSSSRISFRHLIKKAAQTYRWKCENPSGSDCGQKNSGSAPAAQREHDFPGTQISYRATHHPAGYKSPRATLLFFPHLPSCTVLPEDLHPLIYRELAPQRPAKQGRQWEPAYLVGIPEADGAAKRQLPHKQIVHPAKGKLQVFDLVLPKVIMYLL